jgi:pSer/pThr/pTyr-binding forkhead associated (FHA) protein
LRLIGPPEPLCAPLRLVALRGTRVIELHQPEVVLGRHSEADVQIVEADVSRFHCRFLCLDEQWEIEDLNSLNGTYVNGEPVQRQLLRQGDVVRVGDFLFQTDLGAPRELCLAAADEARRSRHVLQAIAAMLPDEECLPQRRSA